MATNTPNLNLQKPAYTDKLDIQVVNTNMDSLDTAVTANKTAASEAKTAADRAQSTADSANSAAGRAQSTADTANTAAGNAQTTANTAKSLAEAAQTTANGKAAVKTYSATLTTGGWSSSAPYTQSVAVSGITAAITPIVDVVLSTTTSTAKLQLEAWGLVGRITTTATGITAYCYDEKPTTAIPIQLKVVE